MNEEFEDYENLADLVDIDLEKYHEDYVSYEGDLVDLIKESK